MLVIMGFLLMALVVMEVVSARRMTVGFFSVRMHVSESMRMLMGMFVGMDVLILAVPVKMCMQVFMRMGVFVLMLQGLNG